MTTDRGQGRPQPGGPAYYEFVRDQLVEERNRKNSLETKATWVAGVVVAVLTALLGIVLRADEVSVVARILPVGVAIPLVVAGRFVFRALRPKTYPEPSPAHLRERVTKEDEWHLPAATITRELTLGMLTTLEEARKINNESFDDLRRGMFAALVAIAFLVVSIATVPWFAAPERAEPPVKAWQKSLSLSRAGPGVGAHE